MMLAATDNISTLIPDLGKSGGISTDQWKYFAIILGVSLAVGLVVVLVVKLTRSRSTNTVGRSGGTRRRRGGGGGGRKRERYTHRNPTRAEMGGLPPVREEPPAEAAPPQ
jgi:hypothetical protein